MTTVPEAVPQPVELRYSNVNVAFHWTTVALVLTQIALGFTFASLDHGPVRTDVFAWHKTVGLLILLITLARLAYRLNDPPPPYSPDLPKWERISGTWNHRIFYALLIGMPLGGYVAASGHTDGPTTPLAFGFSLPVIPGVSEELGELAAEAHEIGAFIFVALILLHAAAALKHQFIDRIPAAGRMPPFRTPHGKPTAIGQGSAARSRED